MTGRAGCRNVSGVPRDEDARSSARSSEPLPDADPHGDVNGALHDVSNALTVLLGWVAEARSGRSTPAQLERALAIVEEKAREARDVARRAIGAQITIHDRDASLDEVVADVREAVSVEADRARVALDLSRRAGGADARVAGAADLSRILTNLFLNALAWTPAGGRVSIEIETDADPEYACVTVSDEGPGVEPKSAPRLFDGTKSTRKGGAGVGLKHARSLARAAGGDLELVLGGGSRGARFRLRWPRLQPSSVAPAPTSSPSAAVLAGSRVLVVEDDHDVATLLESALQARGARVVVVRSADELARAAELEHDVALVDLSPIARDVRGAIEALRAGSPGLRLVFISGSAVGLPEGFEGEARWVRKPFEVAEVVAALVDQGSRQSLS